MPSHVDVYETHIVHAVCHAPTPIEALADFALAVGPWLTEHRAGQRGLHVKVHTSANRWTETEHAAFRLGLNEQKQRWNEEDSAPFQLFHLVYEPGHLPTIGRARSTVDVVDAAASFHLTRRVLISLAYAVTRAHGEPGPLQWEVAADLVALTALGDALHDVMPQLLSQHYGVLRRLLSAGLVSRLRRWAPGIASDPSSQHQAAYAVIAGVCHGVDWPQEQLGASDADARLAGYDWSDLTVELASPKAFERASVLLVRRVMDQLDGCVNGIVDVHEAFWEARGFDSVDSLLHNTGDRLRIAHQHLPADEEDLRAFFSRAFLIIEPLGALHAAGRSRLEVLGPVLRQALIDASVLFGQLDAVHLNRAAPVTLPFWPDDLMDREVR
ncbi:MAG: hypothetical protein AB8H79_20140 [Myxococcota bacterium]